MLHECPAEQKITYFEEGPRETLRLTRQSGPNGVKGVIDGMRVARSTMAARIGGVVLAVKATFRRLCGAGRSDW
jgi:hypothetical protein